MMYAPDSRIFPFRQATSDYATEPSRDKPFVVMYHGSIVERNGLDIAIDAVARAREVSTECGSACFRSDHAVSRTHEEGRAGKKSGTDRSVLRTEVARRYRP